MPGRPSDTRPMRTNGRKPGVSERSRLYGERNVLEVEAQALIRSGARLRPEYQR